MTKNFCVCKYTPDGQMVGVLSGMGEHQGTMDSDHTLADARRFAEECKAEDPTHRYVVEYVLGGPVDEDLEPETLAPRETTVTATLSLERCRDLFERLSDVPVNDDGQIQDAFLHFKAGTNREDIWHYLEGQNPDFSVAEAMGVASPDDSLSP